MKALVLKWLEIFATASLSLQYPYNLLFESEMGLYQWFTGVTIISFMLGLRVIKRESK